MPVVTLTLLCTNHHQSTLHREQQKLLAEMGQTLASSVFCLKKHKRVDSDEKNKTKTFTFHRYLNDKEELTSFIFHYFAFL